MTPTRAFHALNELTKGSVETGAAVIEALTGDELFVFGDWECSRVKRDDHVQRLARLLARVV